MSITIERVKELRAPAKRTPWQHDPDYARAPILDCTGHSVIEADGYHTPVIDADSDDLALMAAAPDIADLCIAQAAEIEKLRASLKAAHVQRQRFANEMALLQGIVDLYENGVVFDEE